MILSKAYANRKRISFIVGLFLTLLGIFLNYTYRRYIYANHLFDFHIADTIGSILCVPAAAFFFYGIINEKITFMRLLIGASIANILYELLSLSSIHGTFDFYDLIAIIAGTAITLILAQMTKNLLLRSEK